MDLVFLAHSLLKRLLGPKLLRCVKPLGHPGPNLWFKREPFLALAAFLALILWLVLDTSQRPEQLVSFGGICMFISLLFAFSKHHRAVSWRAVSWGLVLQFTLGLFVIRTEPGFIAFQWLGDQIQVLPITVFFICAMSVLYYVSLMQWVILKGILFSWMISPHQWRCGRRR